MESLNRCDRVPPKGTSIFPMMIQMRERIPHYFNLMGGILGTKGISTQSSFYHRLKHSKRVITGILSGWSLFDGHLPAFSGPAVGVFPPGLDSEVVSTHLWNPWNTPIDLYHQAFKGFQDHSWPGDCRFRVFDIGVVACK